MGAAVFDEFACWLVMERAAMTVAWNQANHLQRIQLRIAKHRALLASEPDVNALIETVNSGAESVAILKLA